MPTRIPHPFLSGILLASGAYYVIRTRIESDTWQTRKLLWSARRDFESSLPEDLKDTTFLSTPPPSNPSLPPPTPLKEFTTDVSNAPIIRSISSTVSSTINAIPSPPSLASVSSKIMDWKCQWNGVVYNTAEKVYSFSPSDWVVEKYRELNGEQESK